MTKKRAQPCELQLRLTVQFPLSVNEASLCEQVKRLLLGPSYDINTDHLVEYLPNAKVVVTQKTTFREPK